MQSNSNFLGQNMLQNDNSFWADTSLHLPLAPCKQIVINVIYSFIPVEYQR